MSRVRTFFGELEQLERLADAFDEVQQRRAKRRRDDALGVLELEEVSPGVYAPGKPKPRRRILAEARDLLDDIEHVRKAVKP